MQTFIPALILHIILIITNVINNPINYNNLCIEYIFLKENREIHDNQQLRLYHVTAVSIYVTKKGKLQKHMHDNGCCTDNE